MRFRDGCHECFRRISGHAQLSERNAAALLVEQTQHDALTMQCRQRRDTHVDLTIAQSQANTTVLRNAAFRDIELSHDLEAADDCSRQTRRWCGRILQYAIDAVTNAKPAL